MEPQAAHNEFSKTETLQRDLRSIVKRLNQFVDTVKEIEQMDSRAATRPGPSSMEGRGSRLDQMRALGLDQLEVYRKKMYPVYLRDGLAEQRKPRLGRDISDLFSQVQNPVYHHAGINPYATPGTWLYPEYNFSEVGIIEETEPLVARAFERKISLALKEGHSISGKNPRTVDYMLARISEVMHCSDSNVEQTLETELTDMTRVCNHFGVYVRDDKRSSGKRRRIKGKDVPPIAAIFPVPVETVMLKHDAKGRIEAIAQESWGSGKRVVFGPNNFFHMKRNYRTGMSVGTPSLVPVKDDIAALRRIEEDVEILLYQHLFPLYHYKVGTDKMPPAEYPDGVNEIDQVRDTWSVMPSEGALVTSYRHEIEVLGAKQAALDAYEYLEYFKRRVLAGLGISSLDIGEASTSNRSTSDSLSRILIDSVKYLQRVIEHQFLQYIIRPLLFESSFPEDQVIKEENLVYLKFAEIDIDSQIKKENHANTIFTAHGTTHAEYRRALGREPMSEEEWKDGYQIRVDEPKSLLSSKASGHSAEAQTLAEHPGSSITPEAVAAEKSYEEEQARAQREAKAKSSSSSGGSDKESSGVRAARASNQPSNQHGKKSGPEKRKSSRDTHRYRSTLSTQVWSDTQPESQGNQVYALCQSKDTVLPDFFAQCFDAVVKQSQQNNVSSAEASPSQDSLRANALKKFQSQCISMIVESTHAGMAGDLLMASSLTPALVRHVSKECASYVDRCIALAHECADATGAHNEETKCKGADILAEYKRTIDTMERQARYTIYASALLDMYVQSPWSDEICLQAGMHWFCCDTDDAGVTHLMCYSYALQQYVPVDRTTATMILFTQRDDTLIPHQPRLVCHGSGGANL